MSAILRLWPALAGIAAVLGVALWIGSLTDRAYDRGVSDERRKWEAAEAKRHLQFRERADIASGKAAERQAARERVFVPIEREVIRYVQTPAAAVRCFDDAGRDIMRRSIEAANADIATPSGAGGTAVPATR